MKPNTGINKTNQFKKKKNSTQSNSIKRTSIPSKAFLGSYLLSQKIAMCKNPHENDINPPPPSSFPAAIDSFSFKVAASHQHGIDKLTK